MFAVKHSFIRVRYSNLEVNNRIIKNHNDIDNMSVIGTKEGLQCQHCGKWGM